MYIFILKINIMYKHNTFFLNINIYVCIYIDIIIIHSTHIYYVKHIYIYIYIYIRGGTVHVFVLNRHDTDLSVRCMRPYDEYRQFMPNPEGGAHSNATLFDNRQLQQKNSECCL